MWANLEAAVGDKHESVRLLAIADKLGFHHWEVVEGHDVFRHVIEMDEYRNLRHLSPRERVVPVSAAPPQNHIYMVVPDIPEPMEDD